MDRVHVIRHKVLVEGLSRRRVAQEMGISRNTVKKYVTVQTVPKRKATEPRGRPVLERVRPRLEELIEEWADRQTPKQRVTAKRGGKSVGQVEQDIDGLGRGLVGVQIENFLKDVTEIQVDELELQLAGFDRREVQNVIDDVQQPFGRAVGGLGQPKLFRG